MDGRLAAGGTKPWQSTDRSYSPSGRDGIDQRPEASEMALKTPSAPRAVTRAFFTGAPVAELVTVPSRVAAWAAKAISRHRPFIRAQNSAARRS